MAPVSARAPSTWRSPPETVAAPPVQGLETHPVGQVGPAECLEQRRSRDHAPVARERAGSDRAARAAAEPVQRGVGVHERREALPRGAELPRCRDDHVAGEVLRGAVDEDVVGGIGGQARHRDERDRRGVRLRGRRRDEQRRAGGPEADAGDRRGRHGLAELHDDVGVDGTSTAPAGGVRPTTTGGVESLPPVGVTVTCSSTGVRLVTEVPRTARYCRYWPKTPGELPEAIGAKGVQVTSRVGAVTAPDGHVEGRPFGCRGRPAERAPVHRGAGVPDAREERAGGRIGLNAEPVHGDGRAAGGVVARTDPHGGRDRHAHRHAGGRLPVHVELHAARVPDDAVAVRSRRDA